MKLDIGAKAPAFSAEKDGGGKLSLNDYKDKWLVLYFYPKDNTSGCTKEACGFRDNMEALTAMGAEVIGVSPDNLKSHDGFKAEYHLNFNLVSDPDKKICEMYGVLGEKKMYGKTYIGLVRSTFIIDKKGIIRKIFENVKVDGHVEEVKLSLKELIS